jgi:cell division protein FtsI (penicillin-binding protein 3)
MRASAGNNSNSRRAEITKRLRNTKPINLPGYHNRVVWVWLLLLLGQFGLITRLFWLQVNQGPKLGQMAKEQRMRKLSPKSSRHSILDRNGNILAKDEPSFRLFVHPVMFKKSKADIATELSPIIKMPVDELTRLFETGKTGIPVTRNIPEDGAAAVRKLALDGVELNQEWSRVYPQKDLMSSIVGYVNADHLGQAGLEYSLQSWLMAQPPSAKVSEDGNGYLLPNEFSLRPLNAEELNLKLTLDTRLQWSATTALHKKLKQYNALRGAVMVMDVKDGSLLALVAEPSYDPTRFYKANPALFRNWAITDLYEPGSTFKPINIAIALDAKAIQPDTVVYDEGHISVGGWPIQNNDGSSHGAISITKVLEVSSNIGMVHIMERVKRATYYDFLKTIGIGEMTGTDMPSETAGTMKGREQFIDYPIEAATNSFGQGFSVTPIQMVQLHAAIANGGIMVTPHVTEGLFEPSGKLINKSNLIPPRRIFSKESTASVRKMMESVVQNGTGQPAKIPGYRLGGKTGTAQKASGGTYQRSRITSFVATFPAESPRYVIFAVVDEPKGDDAFGSTVAAPIVKSVIETLISVEGIPPSHPEELKRPEALKKSEEPKKTAAKVNTH